MYAAAGNQDPNVHATLVARGAEVDARSLARWTALMYAARDNPNPEVVLRLLELGADPQLVNGDGQTALDLARGNPALQDTDVLNRLEVLTRVAPPAGAGSGAAGRTLFTAPRPGQPKLLQILPERLRLRQQLHRPEQDLPRRGGLRLQRGRGDGRRPHRCRGTVLRRLGVGLRRAFCRGGSAGRNCS